MMEKQLVSVNFQDTKTMAAIIRTAPIPWMSVSGSCKRTEEIAKATITSAKRIIVEFTAEMYFKPSDHK